MCCCCCECLGDILLIIVSVLFPPLPVWIRRGVCSLDSLINILLCVLGYFPGLIHSWYIIAKYPPYSNRHESKIYYVQQNSHDLERQVPHIHHHHHSHNYGTVVHEPQASHSPNYGATADCEFAASSSAIAPPAYSELPTKK